MRCGEQTAAPPPAPSSEGGAAAAAANGANPAADADPKKRKWYYLDGQGKEQGPWHWKQMQAWHAAGFFVYNDPKIRTDTEHLYVQFSKRPTKPFWAQSQPGVAPPHPAAAAPVPRPAVHGETTMWKYLDKEGKEQGPFPTGKMREW